MADADAAGAGAGADPVADAGVALGADVDDAAWGSSVYGTLCGARKREPFWPHPLAKAVIDARKSATNRLATLAPKISLEKIITGL